MMPNNEKTLKIRPYARLLTMLGDQLIKNEIVALTELIKNSYDADADFCNVSFDSFSELYENSHSSSITISDNGDGMSYDIITNHFLNPATPVKRKVKNTRKSKKGRICQGEKGIGRFSMLKLGKKVTIYSKEENVDVVHKVLFDFDKYDNEFLTLFNKDADVYLDEIVVGYQALSVSDIPIKSTINEYNKGTIILVESLKGNWDDSKIRLLKEDMVKFSPLEISDEKITTNNDFTINLFKNGKEDPYYEYTLHELRRIISDKALYKVSGSYDEKNKKIDFTYIEANTVPVKISIPFNSNEGKGNLFAQKLYALREYRNVVENFFDNDKTTICGSFKFEFYIFYFNADKHDDFWLSKSEKNIIKDHRVFLYRDEVRVQPYGAPNDDWLQIDRNRATTRANEAFSNDQLIGQIKITKKDNENLKDKTSREGIIEDGKAFEQLISIVRVFLSLIRTALFQIYTFKKQKQAELIDEQKFIESKSEFSNLKKLLDNNPNGQMSVAALEAAFEKQRHVYESRLNMAEGLAGVGLSVEVASHDIMLTMDRLKERLSEISSDFNSPITFEQRKHIIKDNVMSAEEMFALIYMKMKDLQQIFVSSKQRPKNIKIREIVQKIYDIYSKQYKKHGIEVKFVQVGKSPVVAKIIDAVIFQVFINLFDNSLYWLQYAEMPKKVLITFNGDEQSVTFSDNGVGISKEDSPFVFDAFYSGKGEDGRGLGLYIAKRLLNKNKFDIELITEERLKLLEGANFVVSFISSDEEVV